MVHAMMERLFEIEGVTEVWGCQNTDNHYDYHKMLPPGSFRISVEGGKKKAIAQVIWEMKSIGVVSCGDTCVTVKDSFGYKHHIYFQRIPK
jgi:hypothetical protein